ncbi:MAG TPA: hypothetical protein VHB46_19350 [Burkholderiales bacterium]|nr:hypothetical protein [Burkholderiales bacterium]
MFALEEGYSFGDYRGFAIISNITASAGGKYLASFVVEDLNRDKKISEPQHCLGTYLSEKEARFAAYAEAERYIDSITP